MSDKVVARFTHTDMSLMRLRIKLSPGQRIQAMLHARELLVGMIRGRLRPQFPTLSESELNLKVLEEIDRAQSVKPWPQSISQYLG